jgi:hypothetical protein
VQQKKGKYSFSPIVSESLNIQKLRLVFEFSIGESELPPLFFLSYVSFTEVDCALFLQHFYIPSLEVVLHHELPHHCFLYPRFHPYLSLSKCHADAEWPLTDLFWPLVLAGFFFLL